MSDETRLRKQAREAIRTGGLPNRRPDRMWGGPGNGTTCVICGGVLTRDETAFEIEFACPLEGGPSLGHHFHVRCFAAWELERDASADDAQALTHPHGGANGASGDEMSSSHRARIAELPTAGGGGTMTHREPSRFNPGAAE